MKRLLLLCLTVLLPIACARGQESCSAEVKVLLVPSEVPRAIESLHAGKARSGHVSFFDTNSLDLLSKGIILRVRQGSSSDLTVKVRSTAADAHEPSSRSGAKCEFDVVGPETVRSYSITRKFPGELPESGTGLLPLLSPDQRKMTESLSIPWNHVKRIARIQSTTWQIAMPPEFPKLSLELWEWPTGKILELSSRVPVSEESSGYEGLQRLIAAHGLSLSAKQSPKTTIALENIGHRRLH